jgi:hypothetical protein
MRAPGCDENHASGVPGPTQRSPTHSAGAGPSHLCLPRGALGGDGRSINTPVDQSTATIRCEFLFESGLKHDAARSHSHQRPSLSHGGAIQTKEVANRGGLTLVRGEMLLSAILIWRLIP